MMEHAGEAVALIVAVSWTASAMLSEVASKRIGEAVTNVYRMVLAIAILWLMLEVTGQTSVLTGASGEAWMWLLGSGLVGYTFGDYCLYNAYAMIGARRTQLFMTLAAPFAALAAWLMLGETLTWRAGVGMVLTLTGIAMSVVSRGDAEQEGTRRLGLKIPRVGVLLATGAAMGQGVGLVLSKIGMNAMGTEASMAPAAGTIMRGLAGLAGFSVMLFARKKQGGMGEALSGKNMLLLTSLAVFGPAVGVTLSLKAAQMTEVGIAQTIMATTPILIIAPAYIIFHQKIGVMDVVGAVISVAGVAMFF